MSWHDDLRTLAEAATPGPWDNDFGQRIVVGEVADGAVVVAVVVEDDDAAYITAASPDRILALLLELDALQSAQDSTYTVIGKIGRRLS